MKKLSVGLKDVRSVCKIPLCYGLYEVIKNLKSKFFINIVLQTFFKRTTFTSDLNRVNPNDKLLNLKLI